MKEHLTVFLSKPLRWEPAHAPDEMKREAVAAIQRLLAEQLMQFFLLNGSACTSKGLDRGLCATATLVPPPGRGR